MHHRNTLSDTHAQLHDLGIHGADLRMHHMFLGVDNVRAPDL